MCVIKRSNELINYFNVYFISILNAILSCQQLRTFTSEIKESIIIK